MSFTKRRSARIASTPESKRLSRDKNTDRLERGEEVKNTKREYEELRKGIQFWYHPLNFKRYRED